MTLSTFLFAKRNDVAAPHRRRRLERGPARPPAAVIEPLETRRLMTAITGVVYADTNGNGARDTGEPGVPGIEVTYDSSNNTSTAGDGTFTVGGAAASSGSHYVAVATPSGWTLTQPSGDSYLNTGADASLSFGVEFTPGLAANAPSASEVDLSWSNGDSALHAVIQRSSDAGSTWTTLTSTPLSSGATTYADTDPALAANTSYEYKLTMVDSSANPIASAVATVTTLSGTLTTVHDTTLTISTGDLGTIGAIPWSSWTSGSIQTGTTALGGNVTANDDGTWTYTPPSQWAGSDTLTYVLSNGTTTSAPLPITVAVTDQAPQASDEWNETVNSDPTNTANAAPSITVDSGTWFAVGASDADGDTLTYHLVNSDGSAASADGAGNVATAHGTVSLTSDGTYTYTPAAGFVGVDRFYYLANDGVENSNVATVTIDVTSGMPLLGVSDVLDPAAIGDSFTFSLEPGTYQNVDFSQLEILSQPANGSVGLNSDGSFVYTAAANGLTSFTFGMGSDVPPSTILIDVNTGYDFTWGGLGGNVYSVAHGDTLSEAAPGLLSGVEYTPGGSLSVSLLSGPTTGTLTLGTSGGVHDGSFTYTPDANTTGWVYFSYDVQGGGATSPPLTAAIFVSDDLPISYQSAATVSTTPGTPVNFDPRTPFVSTETPLDTLTTSIPTSLGPQHGSLTVNSDGTLTYTPTAGFTGTDSFTYQVNDGVTSASFGSISQTDSLNSGYCTMYITVASS